MTKNDIKDFSIRVSTSSKTELIVVTYDIIEKYIDTAIEAYENDDLDSVVFNLQKAKQFVNNLSSSLDFRYSISRELMSLYIYVNNCLMKDIVKRKPNNAEIIKQVLGGLRESFKQVSTLDNSGKAMKNTEQVYVGYTYGRSSRLNEMVMR